MTSTPNAPAATTAPPAISTLRGKPGAVSPRSGTPVRPDATAGPVVCEAIAMAASTPADGSVRFGTLGGTLSFWLEIGSPCIEWNACRSASCMDFASGQRSVFSNAERTVD